jgi:cellobiose phosphorylase
MYRLGLEAILGFHKVGNTLQIDPVIPPNWDGFEISYQFGESIYKIQVQNPEHVGHGNRQIVLDGQFLIENFIQMVDDRREHDVIVIMGSKL